MAKSVRSKRRQKVLAIRREKYREREKKKLWEKHLAIQAQRTVDMDEVEGGEMLNNLYTTWFGLWLFLSIEGARTDMVVIYTRAFPNAQKSVLFTALPNLLIYSSSNRRSPAYQL